MKQTNPLLTFALGTLFFAGGALQAAKPNFIIIFADDQGYGDLSCFGSKTIRTPNIDRIAKEGRKFTSFMVASPVCTPSRSALLTGCYPKRVGMHQHVLFPSSTKGLNPKEHTIADHLKSQGYATACFGKWHLGDNAPCRPQDQGFEHVVWHHGGGVGMGFSQHSGVVILCDGTDDAAKRIARVLHNDPATGVMRHADAGYEIAKECAKKHNLDLPMVDKKGDK